MNKPNHLLAIFLLIIIAVSADAQFPEFTRIDTGTLVQEIVRGRGMYPVDIDMDGDLDLYIGNSTGMSFPETGSGNNRPNLIYRNERNCRFTKIEQGILAEKRYDTNPGNNWGDFDNDGDWDLFNHGEIYVNGGFGNIEEILSINDASEYCGTWVDFNSDGYLDIFTNVIDDGGNNVGKEGNYMYKNNGDGTFNEVNVGAPNSEAFGMSQSSAWADCDNDGDLDIFEANLVHFQYSPGQSIIY